MQQLLADSWESYVENFRLILFFSLPFLLAVPVAMLLPNYLALGGAFMRFASVPVDVQLTDIVLMIVGFVISLVLICFALVNITMLVRAQRGLIGIRREWLEAVGKYTSRVFWTFLFITALIMLANIWLFEWGLHDLQGQLIAFVLWLPLFYVPQAVVIDEMGPVKAMAASIRAIGSKPQFFLLWLALGIVALSVVDGIALATGMFEARWAVLAVNALVVLPFLTVMQTHAYIRKFTILHH